MDKTMAIDGKNNDFSTELFNIDKRLQEALGHCLKYFQEVPLPNCHCVNFGRYGSFLPDCQHSPCNSPSQDLSQHVFSDSVSKSCQDVPLNNGCTTSCGGVKPLLRKNGPATTTITSRAACNSARNNVRGKGSVICASDQSNHAMPETHIKLDRETPTTPKNKRILRSLGLVMSSSSSEGDSPICGRHSASPTCISESVMTTRPISEDVFLSPLSNTLDSLVGTPREVDRHSCESTSKNSNPLIGDVSISKDENYVNAVKVSPLRNEAFSLISSPRECLERQNVCMSNPCEVQQMKISSPIELQKLTDEVNKAIREANDLKYLANGLKTSGLRIESTEIFFQAALKYLDAASRLETHVSGSAKIVALTPFEIYDTAAKLLEYCAEEYESCKDMACASLAYKCLEASNMQIVYATDDDARRDSQELQVSMQSITESYPLDSRSRSMFVQLLNFAQCANSAMEASRKSRITFGYASSVLEEMGSTEVVDCMRRALNYGFRDMKKLLHLVCEAMEALSS